MKLQDDYIVDLAEFGILEVTGDDSKAFLQSQLTSDISNIAPGTAQYSSWCNPQGRIITTMLVINEGRRFSLLVPVKLLDAFKKQISIYILRSKVAFSLPDSPLQVWGISGRSLIQHIRTSLEQNTLSTGLLMFELPDKSRNRAMMVSSKSALEEVTDRFKDTASIAGPEYWYYEDILNGVVWITPETTSKLLPQELDLQDLEALSFDKGCFPGQEVIARLHYRGKQKYGLYRGEVLEQQISPVPGQRLYLTEDGASCGTLVSIVQIQNAPVNCLASLNHEKAASQSYLIEKSHPVSINFSAIDS